MNVLIHLCPPGETWQQYVELIAPRHPELTITGVDNLDALEAAIPEADILLSFGAPLRRDVFTRAKRLKWVQALGTGLDGITDQPSLGREVLVTATRGIHGIPMSEAAFMLMLGLLRDFPRVVAMQEQGKWQRWSSRLLHGRIVGILGTGGVAQDLAPRCAAFGMKVIGFSRSTRAVPGFHELRPRDTLLASAPELDILVCLVPLEPDTRGMVSRAVIAALQPTAYVINLARGAVIDQDALLEALQEGRIAGAGLDTFVQEPLPPDHPLWRAPNTICTSHTSGAFSTYVDRAVEQFEANLAHFLAGETHLMTHLEKR
jgi:D-2-hydroxyacid dehydrogenase (NADP+)